MTDPALSKEACFDRFWDIIAEALTDLHAKGLIEAEQQPLAEAA